ncbi:MAG TPA: sigma 54-interacting transcriptional regulator [Kofleriaceae bacterium]|nr:sigma 54-interacting transcriptional regulator [Kofleriaceae bacterium]
MVASDTLSIHDESSGASGEVGECLVFAIDCARPHEHPWRVSLAGIDEVVIGRGAPRSVRRVERTAVVALPDASVSAVHARLRRVGGEWVVEDARSKNGTLVNGRVAARSRMSERDVVEIGTTFCLLCRGESDVDAALLATRPLGTRTLSEPLARSFELLARVAASPLPVLLLGETGTGKEMAARAVHALSRRAGPFVAVNCGGLPETLVASELFGARKGAFSGADADRVGLVQEANRGTLFLDEIAELPEASQAVLLRVLQERELIPLGATRAVPVDIRVVAATHQNLAERVSARRFRKDLYARLRGFALTLPPLRERREDLGLLVADLLPRVAGARAGGVTFSRAVARALLLYDWPLNVRELEHTLAAALAVAGSDEIAPVHLPEDVRAAFEDAASIPALRERERFVTLAHQHSGNVSAMARALGTSRSHVRRLAHRYQVELDAVRH